MSEYDKYKKYSELVEHRLNEQYLPRLKHQGISFSGEEISALKRYINAKLTSRFTTDTTFANSVKKIDKYLQDVNIMEINLSNLDLDISIFFDLGRPIQNLLFDEHPDQQNMLKQKIRSELYGTDDNILKRIEKETLTVLNKVRFYEEISKKKRGYKQIVGSEFSKLYKTYSTFITKSKFSKFVLPIIRDRLNMRTQEWSERKFLDHI